MKNRCGICGYRLNAKDLPGGGEYALMVDGQTRYHADPHDCIALLRADLRVTDKVMADLAADFRDLAIRFARLERKIR